MAYEGASFFAPARIKEQPVKLSYRITVFSAPKKSFPYSRYSSTLDGFGGPYHCQGTKKGQINKDPRHLPGLDFLGRLQSLQKRAKACSLLFMEPPCSSKRQKKSRPVLNKPLGTAWHLPMNSHAGTPISSSIDSPASSRAPVQTAL